MWKRSTVRTRKLGSDGHSIPRLLVKKEQRRSGNNVKIRNLHHLWEKIGTNKTIRETISYKNGSELNKKSQINFADPFYIGSG